MKEGNTRINKYPERLILPALLFVGEVFFYFLGGKAAEFLGIRTVNVKIPRIDDAIPVIPLFFIPYAYAYIFWISVPLKSCFGAKSRSVRYLIDGYAGFIMGALVLAVFPAVMNRSDEGLLGQNAGTGLKIIQFLCYRIDGWERNTRIMPSFHCLSTTITALEVLRSDSGKGYKCYSIIVWALITLSVVFVKQHYFLDAVVGTAIGCAAVLLGGKLYNERSFK